MGTKNNPGAYDCHAKGLPDEPMFVLLARDRDAPYAVLNWARNRRNEIQHGSAPESDQAMVGEARKCAADMIAWRIDNDGAWRETSKEPAKLYTLQEIEFLPDGNAVFRYVDGIERLMPAQDAAGELSRMYASNETTG